MNVGDRYVPYKQFVGSFVPDWLEAQPSDVVPSLTKLLFARLARYAGKDGACYPSQELLARDLGVSISTIEKHVQRLKRLGLIATHRNMVQGRNNYTFLVHEWNLPCLGRQPYRFPDPPARADQEPQAVGDVHPHGRVDIRESQQEGNTKRVRKESKYLDNHSLTPYLSEVLTHFTDFSHLSDAEATRLLKTLNDLENDTVPLAEVVQGVKDHRSRYNRDPSHVDLESIGLLHRVKQVMIDI